MTPLADVPIVEVPKEPMLLHQLPRALRLQWIAKHRECFPELWNLIPHDEIYDELYTMDLRELLTVDGARC